MCKDHITEIEIKIAYQEDLLQSLNEIVSLQQKQIIRLEATCKLLNDRLKNMTISEGMKQEIEMPPHY